MLQNFRVFQMSAQFYQQTKDLKLPDFLKIQLLRASSSIPLNIAEGAGRRTAPDQARFYAIALGSVRECEAIFAIERINDPLLIEQLRQIGAILLKLSRPQTTKNHKR